MDAKLQARCERQVEIEKSLRNLATGEAEETHKIGALLYNALGITEDDDKLEACRKILLTKQGFFANLGGVLRALLVLKMSLADDAEKYIDGVIDVHDKLTKDAAIAGLFSILTAVIIYDERGDQDIDAVIPQVQQMFKEVQTYNAPLANDSDLAYIALMLLSGKADKKIEVEKEEIFKAFRNKFQLELDAAQASTLVLITSNKPAEEKVNKFAALYEDLKEAGHATSTKRCISIYGAFTDIEADHDELVQTICEVDKYMKSKKGYGAFSISADFRRIMAATLTLQYYTIDVPETKNPGTYTLSTGISIEALLFIILMSIVAVN